MSCQSNALAETSLFWEKTYSDNFANLCARTRRRLTKGNAFEAEDAVSDAFLRVMQKSPEAIQSPASYWWTAIKRGWFDKQTSAIGCRTEYLEDMSPEAVERLASVRVEPKALRALEQEDSWRALRLKLGPLTLEEQKLVKGRLDGLSFEQIARGLGENVKLTRFRWYRLKARQRCRSGREKSSRGL